MSAMPAKADNPESTRMTLLYKSAHWVFAAHTDR